MILFGAVNVKGQDINHTQSTSIENLTEIVLLAAIPIMVTESLHLEFKLVAQMKTIVLAKVNIQLAFTDISVSIIKILKYFCPD